MAETSRWRLEARRVITAVLDALPVTASRKDAARAIRVAYPFGEMECHPYKMWLIERRLALEDRFSSKAKAKLMSVVPTIAYALRPDWLGRTPRLWLGVACDWCRKWHSTGCISCLRHRARVQHAVRGILPGSTFLGLCEQALTDHEALYPLLDLCEEALGERPLVQMKGVT